ncbi:hypothetical protein [Variovorax sp. dw_308]|nr:hypothetical protein [Variovorax sp. dw_308]
MERICKVRWLAGDPLFLASSKVSIPAKALIGTAQTLFCLGLRTGWD